MTPDAELGEGDNASELVCSEEDSRPSSELRLVRSEADGVGIPDTNPF